jgi:hypothetical protein
VRGRGTSGAYSHAYSHPPELVSTGTRRSLDDTVEFFNPVLETHLTATERKDLVTFLKAL